MNVPPSHNPSHAQDLPHGSFDGGMETLHMPAAPVRPRVVKAEPPLAPKAPFNRTVPLFGLLTVRDALQTFSNARKTGQVKVEGIPGVYIQLIDGQVTHAVCGAMTGLDAAIAIINIEGAEANWKPDEAVEEDTITVPVMEVLMEAMRRFDEGGPTRMLLAASLFVYHLDGSVIETPLRPGASSVGRRPDSAICLPNPNVSGNHSEVWRASNWISVRDLGSTNGTFVNGYRIGEEAVSLFDGDEVVFGPIRSVLQLKWAGGRPPTAR